MVSLNGIKTGVRKETKDWINIPFLGDLSKVKVRTVESS